MMPRQRALSRLLGHLRPTPQPRTCSPTSRPLMAAAAAAAEHGEPKPARRVGLLGIGAIGETVARALLRPPNPTATPPAVGEPGGVEGAELTAVLVSDSAKHADKRAWLGQGVLLTDDPEAFFAEQLDVVVEAAGQVRRPPVVPAPALLPVLLMYPGLQPAVVAYGERCLRAGHDLLVTSTGALTDDALHAQLHAIARQQGRLHLCSGAMPGLDWLQAAAMGGGVKQVRVVQSKPPASWIGTVAEEQVQAVADWDAHGPLTIFEGVAREAAAAFPKSSNVTATLALATVGLDATQVRLVADPKPFFSTHLELESAAGRISIEAEHRPSATNPKTSADVALSVLRSLRAVCSPVYVGT